jgi:hypothetical protein
LGLNPALIDLYRRCKHPVVFINVSAVMFPWLSAIVVIMASVTAPMVVAKKPEWLHKNEPVKNIKQPVQDVLIMRHGNTDLELDKNKK